MQKADSVLEASIPKGSLVLVTGSNGFIASHVADQLLAAGYRVRGTVRDKARTAWLHDVFDGKYGEGKFETLEVPDMVADGAFDEAVKGVSGIVHLASVVSFSNKADEVIKPTVKGTLNILTSASKEPSVKSVVYCSSSTAALIPPQNTKMKVTKDTWNDFAVHHANSDPDPNGYIVYSASKTEAERAFWTAISATKPPFQAVTVLPNCNIGPTLHPSGEMSSSGSWIAKIAQGHSDFSKRLIPQWFVDVQDCARIHVAALADPACDDQRIFAFARPFNCNDLLAVMRAQHPGHHFMEDDPELGRDLTEIPNEDAEALLRKHYGKGWTSLEESVGRNLEGVRL